MNASPPPFPKPEILAPAGHWPHLHAAIEAGADAVYFGLRHFTARAKVGFAIGELPEAMRTLRRRGVKGYVTFNTLVFEHELEEAARALAAIAEAGADAILVQDPAAALLAREIAPELSVHASTQMSLTSAEGVRFAQELGCRRVVLARELSLDDIRRIRAATDCELEIFVHGALCVAVSGQCFSSEAWGGRSANRGKCAQACRLPYELIVDGAKKPLEDARYLLSPEDLSAINLVPEIVSIGISALKIEGRYKDPSYVALATNAYRRAVDEAWEGRASRWSEAKALELEQVYSRGSGPHFLSGTNHQTVVRGRAPRHRGVLVGRVVRATADSVVMTPVMRIASLAPVKPGDGLVFDAADWRSPEEREEGGRVYEVAPTAESRGGVALRFANGAIDPGRIRAGDLVWRTHDPDVDRAARPFTQAQDPVRRRPVDVRVVAVEGETLATTWTLAGEPDVCVSARSSEVLGAGRTRVLDAELARTQLGRLGDTPFALGALDLEVKGRPFAPASVLNRVRREAIDALELAVNVAPQRAVRTPSTALAGLLGTPEAPSNDPRESARLHVLLRNDEQLEAATALRPASITLDYLDLEGVRPAVERVRSHGIPVRVASPRILKPNEERIVGFLKKLDCEILVRSTGLLRALALGPHPVLDGDFSLNAANGITAALVLRMGLRRITPTHDLNGAQVAELAGRVGGGRLEVVAYHHLPVFHTEHCVFCRFLSTGTSYKDCGRPCETHHVALRDAFGREHPVIADVGCRNTVFGAEAQEASRHLAQWLEAGVRDIRVELAHESAAQVIEVGEAFVEAFAGRVDMRELGRRLRRAAPQGTTEGSLHVPEGFATIPALG